MNLYDGSEEKETDCGQDGQQSRYHAQVQPQAVDLIHKFCNALRFCSEKNVIPVTVPAYNLRVCCGWWSTALGAEGVFGVVVLVEGCPWVSMS